MIKKIASLGLLALMAVAPSFAQKMKPVRQSYGANILRFSPISALDIGVGFGLSYERLLGAEKMVGVILPVHLILEDNWNSNNNNTNYNSYFYFTPGLKVYPFGQRRITYAVGPSLMLGYGGGKNWISNDPWGGQELFSKTVFRLGILVNNYINFQLTQNFNLGLEAGLGMKYIDNTKYKSNMSSWTEKDGFDITGEFQLTLGYRF